MQGRRSFAPKKRLRRKEKQVEAEEVDASFQKMANELSVAELEAMIMDTGHKKKKKPRRKKKARRSF